jgi:branched-chain amino acid transport system permease protein
VSGLAPGSRTLAVEANSIARRIGPAANWGPLLAVRHAVGRWGLVAALAALPVYYGIHDLTSGYSGFARGHAVAPHDLTYLGNNLVQGISNGAIWALIAIGYTLVYGIIELINFAHGDVFMIGSFTGAGFWASIGLGLTTGPLGLVVGLLLTLIVSMLVCGSLNVLIERVGYRPLRSAPKLAPLITAVGFSFILQNVGLLWLGGSPAGVSDLIHQNDTVLQISGVVIRRADVLAVGVTIPLVVLLAGFVARTRMGKAMRATAQDPEAARLMGINVDTTISLTFLLGGMLAGAAGLVYALYETTIWYFQGFEAGLIAFTAAVMGGIGNLRGAVLGGLIIGCIQQLSDARIGPQWTPAIVFGYLVMIMVLRPRGLLGEETREAG